MTEYLWSVSSYLTPNNWDRLCPEITLPQTSRRGTQSAPRRLASTSALALDGIPAQRAEYFLFSSTHKLKYQTKNKSLFPITGWHNFCVIWNNKQGHLNWIWFLLGKDITGIQWVYFWFIGLSHFNNPVLTQTYLPVKWEDEAQKLACNGIEFSRRGINYFSLNKTKDKKVFQVYFQDHPEAIKSLLSQKILSRKADEWLDDN